GDLDDPAQAKAPEQPFPGAEEVVVGEEVAQRARVNEQRRFDTRRRGGGEGAEVAGEVRAQGLLVRGVGYGVADPVRLEYAPGEGTKVEPDHDGGNPAAGAVDHGLFLHFSKHSTPTVMKVRLGSPDQGGGVRAGATSSSGTTVTIRHVFFVASA